MKRGLQGMDCRVFSIILAIEQRDSYKAFLKLCLVSQADQSIWEQGLSPLKNA